jgi:hypothetical protein
MKSTACSVYRVVSCACSFGSTDESITSLFSKSGSGGAFSFFASAEGGSPLIISACSGDMSLEYGKPKYSSNPCCSGRNFL